ncbi:MAG: FAD-binding oxidoreductase, partial [Pseudomonadota bacterium]|nr:FAD-binding oxidoreductase [Pseudomonadota bacterium]
MPIIKIQNFLSDISRIVGAKYVLSEADVMAEYLEERRGNYTGEADAVVLPANSAEVASVVKMCADSNIPIVPQGGNTGLCGGAVSKRGQIILNLRRLNRITDVDPINDTMTVEAGCILADIQQAASNIERYFPLSLGAEGSCQIGGNLSTNAGGINVLRYGNAREQVLGLQAVLPDGQIWSDLNELRKNNTGYDLRNLLVGSEGTLGIITAAVLKLYPQPRQVETAFVALKDLDSCLELLTAARIDSGGTLSSFELIPKLGIELAEKHVPGCRNPLSTSSDWHIIMVYSSAANGTDLRLTLENT